MSLDNLTETEQAFVASLESADIPTTQAGLAATFESMAKDEGLVFQNPGDDSAWWRWLKANAITPVLWLIEYLVTVVMPGLFVKTATGSYLDLHGYRMGVDRGKATAAVGVVVFSRASVGVSLTIPTGTIIQTAPINGTAYQVVTTEEGVFSAADESCTVAVKAADVGTAYNLAANYYVVLPDPISGIDAVTNENDWLTTPGTDEEADDDYRERLRAKFSAVSDWHVNSVYKLLISEYTGIPVNRIYIDQTAAPRGAGSADAYLLFDAAVPAGSYIDDINAYITDEGYHGLGDDFQAQAIPETSHDLVYTLYVDENTTDAVKQTLQDNVEQMVRCAFRENTAFDVTLTWPTSRFSFARLSGEILRTYSALVSISWENSDIQSGWDIPRINSLTSTIEEVSI